MRSIKVYKLLFLNNNFCFYKANDAGMKQIAGEEEPKRLRHPNSFIELSIRKSVSPRLQCPD